MTEPRGVGFCEVRVLRMRAREVRRIEKEPELGTGDAARAPRLRRCNGGWEWTKNALTI